MIIIFFFIFLGVCDYVKCFHCGLGFKNWMFYDVPLEEHARWSPNCFYIKTQMNQESIDEVIFEYIYISFIVVIKKI